MRIGPVSHALLMLIAGGTASLILAAGSARAAPRAQTDLVEFEKMTWVEMKSALAAGKTTALIYTGGVEERGPQNANGGHNLIAHATVEAIARELGNAIFMPVLPYTPNDAESIPGTIGITNELRAARRADPSAADEVRSGLRADRPESRFQIRLGPVSQLSTRPSS